MMGGMGGMGIMLAQGATSVDPHWLLQAVLAAGLLASIGANLVQIFRGQRPITPQPLKVTAAEEFVTKEHCLTLHEQSAIRVQSIERTLIELKQERREDIGELHDKVNAVGREVSELKSASAMQSVQLRRMDEKLDQIKAKQ
jgi:hypothetical protein